MTGVFLFAFTWFCCSYKEPDSTAVLKKSGSATVSQPVFKQSGSVEHGTASIFVRHTLLWGVMNAKGEMVQVPQFEDWQPLFKNRDAYLVFKNGKAGVLSKEGKLIIPIEHDAIYANEWTGKKYLSAIKDATARGYDYEALGGKQGIYDTQGRLIIPFNYRVILPQKEGLFVVGNEQFDRNNMGYGVWGLLDSLGRTVFPVQYPFANSGYGLINVGGKFSKTDGTFLNTEGYESVNWFANGGNLLLKKGNNYGLMNNSGKIFVPVEFQEIEGRILYGMVAVNKGKKPYDPNHWREYYDHEPDSAIDGCWGVYNLNGKMVLPMQYQNVSIVAPNLILCHGRKWGAVDTLGKVVLPLEYDELHALKTGLVYAVKNNDAHYYQLNAKNKMTELTQYKIQEFYPWENKTSITIVRVNGAYRALTKTGKFSDTLERKYYDNNMQADSLDEGYILRYAGGYKGACIHIDKNLKANTYNEIVDLEKGYLVKKKNKWGYIGQKGDLQIRAVYDTLVTISGDCVFARKDGSWRIIKNAGKNEIPLILNITSLGPFSEGFAAVGIDGVADAFGGFQQEKWGYLDTTGKIVIDFKFKEAKEFKKGAAAVQIDGKEIPGTKVIRQSRWILIDRHGKQLGKYNFDEIAY